MPRHLVTVAALATLVGCGAQATEQTAAEQPGEPTHTMPDGTVMDGSTHEEHQGSGEQGSSSEPSMTATMICGGLVAEDVEQIMDVEELPEPTSTWDAPMFTCTFDLPQGPLVLRVHDTDDPVAGRAHFQRVRTTDPTSEPLRGLYGLGLPAFASDRGLAVFIRDGKTLEADATGLTGGPYGATQDQDRRDVAYALASSVLACWTAHDAHR